VVVAPHRQTGKKKKKKSQQVFFFCQVFMELGSWGWFHPLGCQGGGLGAHPNFFVFPFFFFFLKKYFFEFFLNKIKNLIRCQVSTSN
jgi:hypothetical protein